MRTYAVILFILYSLHILSYILAADQQKTFSRGPEDDDFGLRPSRPTSTASRPKSAVQLMVDAKLAQFGYTAPPNNSDVPIGEHHSAIDRTNAFRESKFRGVLGY